LPAQGNSTYFFVRKIPLKSNTFEEKTNHQDAEGRNKALFHASFVRLIRLGG
jgi:hypothetical protein